MAGVGAIDRLRVISGAHAVVAILSWVALVLGTSRVVFESRAPDPQIAAAFVVGVLIASAAGSVAAVGAGRTVWSPSRAFALDMAAYVGTAWGIAFLELGTWPRDLGGVVLAAVVVMRLLPGALAIVSGAPSWLALVLALGLYGACASWLPVASAPFGDQIDYLMDADHLAHGSIGTPIDSALFMDLLGVAPSPTDTATHVAQTSLGPRPVQGYAMGLLLLPGWALAGRLGAGVVIAIVGAWTSFMTLLILGDLIGARSRASAASVGDPPRQGVSSLTGWTWLMSTALLPASLLATHEYPNMLGAAIVATAFRVGFTAPARRPALAAALLALTLFLNPRDGLVLIVLLPFLLFEIAPSTEAPPIREKESPRQPSAVGPAPPHGGRWWQRVRLTQRARPVGLAVAVVAVIAVVSNALLYGVPLPYAGYLFGTSEAQAVTHEPSIVPSFWIGLPASLFDRTFGLAGSAPWLFIGLIGLVPALRRDRTRLMPAAATVGVSVIALSFFRLWEGGYAPPGRYFVDMLPLWVPFVAYGLLTVHGTGSHASGHARPAQGAEASLERILVAPWVRTVSLRWALRALTGLLIAISAATAFVFNAVPTLALNSAFDDKIRYSMGRVLGIDPLGWLPSFVPLTPTWWITAYIALIPALLVAAALVWSGGPGVEATPRRPS